MKTTKQLRRELYDKFYRDQETKKFYQSAQWRKVKEMKLRRDPLFESCAQANKTTAAEMVHHLIPIRKGTWKLDLVFLVSLCASCHQKVESEIKKDDRREGSSLGRYRPDRGAKATF